MKIIAFSDLHAHPFKEGRTLPTGINSRLQDCLDALETIFAHAQKIRADYVLFGGDLFHTRKRIDTAAYNEVHRIIAQNPINTLLLPGNHDQYDQLGRVHALERFSGATIVNGAEWRDLGAGVQLLAIPYTHDPHDFLRIFNENISQKPAGKFFLALLHLGVDGTRIGTGRYAYTLDSDIALGDLQPTEFDIILIGHYHTPQQLAENVFYIGAPLQHGWVDEGEERGFMVLDTDQGTIDRIIIDETPKFITVTYGQSIQATPQDFVRVIFDHTPDGQELEQIAQKYGTSAKVSVVPVKKPVLKRSTINLAMTREEMLRQYVETTNCTLPKIVDFGKRLIPNE